VQYGQGWQSTRIERLLGALPGIADEAGIVEGKRFLTEPCLLESLTSADKTLSRLRRSSMSNEIDDDDAPIAHRQNPRSTISLTASRLVLTMCLRGGGALADEFAGVDVDGHERFGWLMTM